MVLLLPLPLLQGQARVHVAPTHHQDTLPVQRHTAFYRRHPPGYAVLVSNLPRLDDSEIRERVKQLFSGYSLRADAVFTDTRVRCHLHKCHHPCNGHGVYRD
jgi:hypothetical protein